MKERSKERYAELLLEELIDHLSKRENVKRMLGEMISMPVEELISILVDDFEKVVEQRISVNNPLFVLDRSTDAIEENKVHQFTEARPATSSVPQESSVHARSITSEPEKTEDENDEEAAEDVGAEPEERRHVENTLDEPGVELAHHENGEEAGDIDILLKRINAHLDERLGISGANEDEGEEAREAKIAAARARQQNPTVVHKHTSRLLQKFDNDDHAYLHAVTRIPKGESASKSPFMLEEKGIDQLNFAFAYDHGELRFYLSKFDPRKMNLSKNGMLLLGKQEEMSLRGVHENAVNDLRVHAVLLPFQFGTVVRGKDEFLRKIGADTDLILEAMKEIHTTTWWTLNLSVLDSRIAELFGDTAPVPARGRERERTSIMKTTISRAYDIKLLEKILQKEKKIAESIHKSLDAIADRSDIDMIVDLTGGSSEDWKVIMKSSYDIPARRLLNFNRAIVDLQYDFMLFDVMLALEGDRSSFSFTTS